MHGSKSKQYGEVVEPSEGYSIKEVVEPPVVSSAWSH